MIEEILKLYDLNIEELVEKAARVTRENFEPVVEFCSIISAKTGSCSENCKYCSQSAHNKAKIEVHPLVSVEDVKKAALSAKENGATYFSIVTSGRSPQENDFEKILDMVQEVAAIDGMRCCCSLGLINDEQAKKLKNAGMARYHHNINTAKSHHDFICSTHTFQDRANTIKIAQKHGIDVCAGVIIGMGETREQRVEMAMQLAELKPVSVPINILNPIEGTPLENYGDKIDEEEILRTICVFRIVMPDVWLRFAGGRNTRFSLKNQKLALKAGINALIVGNMLTTTSALPHEDAKLVTDAGLEIVTS